MSIIERLLVPGSTELPGCHRGGEMHIATHDPIPEKGDAPDPGLRRPHREMAEHFRSPHLDRSEGKGRDQLQSIRLHGLGRAHTDQWVRSGRSAVWSDGATSYRQIPDRSAKARA
jgi:hypothetical protein